MKIVTIVGARPQFIKAAAVSRAIAEYNLTINDQRSTINEVIVHTGQHFDRNMSDVFFEEMDIPRPDYNLNINSMNHGAMTGRMLEKIEEILLKENPDFLLVYGDTNSTLAGALAAAKLHVPVAHVEAGLRSFNRSMPEEINRVMTDHISSFLFCPTRASLTHLANEGITRGVFYVGDVMYDAAIAFGRIAEKRSTIIQDLDIVPGKYLLSTVHRAENTDDPVRLNSILTAFQSLAKDWTIVFPVHPRTRRKLLELTTTFNSHIIDPVSYLDMVQLEKNAYCILTDSGGVQKEAYFHQVPCITLRNETEWVETVQCGWNQVSGTNAESIINAVQIAKKGRQITDYGEGRTSETIIRHLIESNTIAIADS